MRIQSFARRCDLQRDDNAEGVSYVIKQHRNSLRAPALLCQLNCEVNLKLHSHEGTVDN